MSRIIGYCRVSTKAQQNGNSLELQAKKIKKEYINAEIITEVHSSATQRTVFNNLLEELTEGDKLVATTLDRFCRNVREGLEAIDLLQKKGVKIHILNMGLIENTPLGRLILTNLLAFAAFERAQIVERTQAGKDIAKTNKNFRDGRPPKYSKRQVQHALSLLAVNGGKMSYTEAAHITKISKSSLIRFQKESRK